MWLREPEFFWSAGIAHGFHLRHADMRDVSLQDYIDMHDFFEK